MCTRFTRTLMPLFAAAAGHTSLARSLLGRKASASQRNVRGDTPLTLAMQNEQHDTVAVLMKADDTRNAKNPRWSPVGDDSRHLPGINERKQVSRFSGPDLFEPCVFFAFAPVPPLGIRVQHVPTHPTHHMTSVQESPLQRKQQVFVQKRGGLILGLCYTLTQSTHT
jgi:hypothetical protein